MKKLYIDKAGSYYLVHDSDYSIAIWCDEYEIKKGSNGKYVSMGHSKNYIGTIDCDEVEVEFDEVCGN